MGRFGEYLKGFATAGANAYKAAGGARGVADHARRYGEQLGADYKGLHGNMPGVRDYMSSDAGRATARFAAGHALSTFLRRRAQQAGKRGTVGGMLSNAMFTFAHTAFQSHMNNLKHDQRIFENVAKARRGSPELEHLNHQELREISDNAKRYGGKHSEMIKETANLELERRQVRKNEEQAQGTRHKQGLLEGDRAARAQKRHEDSMRRRDELHAQKRQHKEAQHQDKMRRQAELRQTASHVGAKQATDAVAKQHAAAGSAAQPKEHKDYTIKKKTKKGAYVQSAGGKQEWKDNEELAANKSRKTTSVMRANSGRVRLHGGGRSTGGRGRGGR